jgi:acyl transferase domain-containing protein
MTSNKHNVAVEGNNIIGMAGTFPHTKNIEEFKENLQNETEPISVFTDGEEIYDAIDLITLSDDSCLKIKEKLENIDLFDIAFFSSNSEEVEATEAKHHLFLECAWEALENANNSMSREM